MALPLIALLLLWGCSGGDASDRYDPAAGGAAEAATPRTGGEDEPVPTPSRWLLLEDADPRDGGRRIELAREASSGANSSGIPPTLHLGCEDGTTDVYIVWYEDPEGSDNDVTTRIGSAEAIRRTWSNANEDASVFPEDSATAFIRELMEADTLTVRSNLYKRMPITASFELTGLSEAVEPLRDACGW